MKEQTTVIIGATGLIGSNLVQQLLIDDTFKLVRVLVRKPLSILHPKLQQEIVNFDDINDFRDKFGEGDVIFCCVGTTSKKVKGDIMAYEKIDVDILVNAAGIGISRGFKKFLIVSSAGANANSKNFYLKIKGKVENKLKEFSFENIYIFRPGQLLGKRNEKRPGEKILQAITSILSHFLFGSLIKYHSIKAEDVARAMIAASKKEEKGIFIAEYKQMKELISGK